MRLRLQLPQLTSGPWRKLTGFLGRGIMKKKYLLACACVAMVAALACCLAGCGNSDEAKAKNVGKLIDKIYVQERTSTTDADCEAAKKAWDALTDKQKEMVTGENADPGYFGDDTGDASADDPLNQDGIGEKEILVVSFGTSFNDSRVATIGAIEKAIAAANPDWSVRRAFTAQIIINHIQARDGERIDNVQQALDRAANNGVKNLVIQPTHLMHGAEYDELVSAVEAAALSHAAAVSVIAVVSACSAYFFVLHGVASFPFRDVARYCIDRRAIGKALLLFCWPCGLARGYDASPGGHMLNLGGWGRGEILPAPPKSDFFR